MRKIRLLKLDITVIRDTFVTVAAGIYGKRMSVSQDERDASPITTIFNAEWEEDLPDSLLVIGSVRVNDERFEEVNSFEDLYATDKSFYFEYSTQILYIAYGNYRNTIVGDVTKTGETVGFLSTAQNKNINGFKFPIDTYIGELQFEPRLIEGTIEETVDNQSAGIFVFNEMEASFNNGDGKYDTLRRQVTGNNAELLIADISDSPEEEIASGFPYKDAAEADDFKTIQKGVIDDVNYRNPNAPTIRAIDPRADWTQTIGFNLLTTAEFTLLPEEYINTRKPLRIGVVNGCNCIPLREDSTAVDFDYFITDTSYGDIQTITDVYFEGQLDTGAGEFDVDRYLTGGEYSVDLSTGIITIHDCVKGDVFVYGTFTEMSEFVEIVLFLLDEFAAIEYLDSNFNIDEIEIIRDLDYQMFVNLTEEGGNLFASIEKLVLDAQIDFFQLDGVFTMRQSNELRPTTEVLNTYVMLDSPPSWDDNRIETIKTIGVTYGYDYRKETGTLYYNDSLQDQALEENRKAVDKTFSVNMTDPGQVAEIYDEYYSRFTQLARIVTLNMAWPFTANLTDFVEFPVIRRNASGDKEIFSNARYKITSINKNENTAECVFFEETEAPEAIGESGIYGIGIYGISIYGV